MNPLLVRSLRSGIVALVLLALLCGCTSRWQAVRGEGVGATLLGVGIATMVVSGVAAAASTCSESDGICLGPVVPLGVALLVGAPLTIAGGATMGTSAAQRRTFDREYAREREARDVEMNIVLVSIWEESEPALCVGDIGPCAMARRCIVRDEDYACGAADSLAEHGELDGAVWLQLQADARDVREQFRRSLFAPWP